MRSTAAESSDVPKQPCKFRQRDVTRAVKGAEAAGHPVSRVEIDNGRIILILGLKQQPSNSEPNEWDED